MNALEFLREGFQYDLWANKRWLEVVSNFQDPEQVKKILEHICWAQFIWQSRLGLEQPAVQSDDLVASFELAYEGWTKILNKIDPNAEVSYHSLDGHDYVSNGEQIMRHVINHGTYHRGQLRGLAMAENIDAFPETDLIRYFRER